MKFERLLIKSTGEWLEENYLIMGWLRSESNYSVVALVKIFILYLLKNRSDFGSSTKGVVPV